MLENLLKLVQENAGDAIINNPAIPNEQNQVAIETTTSSIFETLKNEVNSGNLADLGSLFANNGNATDALTGNLNADVVSNLMTKLGINNEVATGIAASIIPTVIGKLASKANDPNDSSFDLNGIVNSLGGNGSTMTSIIDMLDGQKDGQTNYGGIIDTVKGFFSK